MEKFRARILVISPYQGMNEIVTEVVRSRNDLEADCYVGDMDEALEILKEKLNPSYDVVVSRGGTAELLNRHSTIPVIDAKPSTLDVLRSIKLAQNFPDKFAVVGFDQVTTQAHTINEVLRYEVRISTISNRSEVKTLLSKLQQEGISRVVCDVITYKYAQELGLNGILITTGFETVQLALDEAMYLAGKVRQQRLNAQLLKQGMELYSGVCTVTDQQGAIQYTSAVSGSNEESLSLSLAKELETSAQSDGVFERKHKGKLYEIEKRTGELNGQKLFYFYLKKLDVFTRAATGAISCLGHEELLDNDLGYYSSSHTFGNTLDLIERYGNNDTPVMIVGENGTGKDRAAFMLYGQNRRSKNLFWQIDFEKATEKDLTYLLNNYRSPLFQQGRFIYFRHLNQAPATTVQKLVEMLGQGGVAKHNRIVCSFVSPSGSTTETKPRHLEQLTSRLACVTLYLPTLRERQDEIPALGILFINRFNAELGKQIIGFEQQALNALSNFSFNGNLDQLRRVIRELMLLSDSSYIGYENTMRVLRQENALVREQKTGGNGINLKQSLEDITYDVVRAVLAEERGNRSNTAKRLGIGRSTLWRILGKAEAHI